MCNVLNNVYCIGHATNVMCLFKLSGGHFPTPWHAYSHYLQTMVVRYLPTYYLYIFGVLGEAIYPCTRFLKLK